MNEFMDATRRKLRFESRIGFLSVEDLWDLPLTSQKSASLDQLAVSLSKKLREGTESFVDASRSGGEELTLKFTIIKQIIDLRLAERNAAKAEREKAEKKQKILAILERKQDAVLENASAEELQTILATL